MRKSCSTTLRWDMNHEIALDFQICDILGSTKEDLEKEIPSLATFDSSQTFKLRQRAEHVFRGKQTILFSFNNIKY